jgi:nucleotide-binding universal stress UspA family protein
METAADDQPQKLPAKSAAPAVVAQPEVEPHAPLVVRHILAPFDGSAVAECALPFVGALARAFSAKVTLLHVLEASETATDAGQGVDSLEWEMARIEALSDLSRVQKKMTSAAQAINIEVVQGRAAEQIVHFAAREGVDLIVMATHGAGGLNDWSLAGTVQKVLGTTEASVVLVPALHFSAGPEIALKRMLVPLDCSARAECILPAATELARVHNAELILAHVVTEPELPRRLSPTDEDLELAERLVERNRSEAQHYLNEIRGRLAATVRVEVRLVVSPRPASALRELAKEEEVDLVVLCAHGNTGDVRQRFGSVPADFLRDCEQPVIIVQDLAQPRSASRAAGADRQGH